MGKYIVLLLLLLIPVSGQHNFAIEPDKLYTRVIEIESITPFIVEYNYNQSRFNFTVTAQIWNPNDKPITTVSRDCYPELQMGWEFDTFNKSDYVDYAIYYFTICSSDEISQTFNPGLTNKTIEGYVTFDLAIANPNFTRTTIDKLPDGVFKFYYPLGSNTNHTITTFRKSNGKFYRSFDYDILNWGDILYNTTTTISTNETSSPQSTESETLYLGMLSPIIFLTVIIRKIKMK